MTSALIRFGMLAALAILTGCAATGAPGDSAVTASGNSDVITFEEIQASPEQEALSIVQSLRPAWLRRRTVGTLSGGSGPVEPEAFVDGARIGPIDNLRMVQAQTIERIEYIGPQQAANRYGLGCLCAVIHVYTRRQ
jgi:hypothetical protein